VVQKHTLGEVKKLNGHLMANCVRNISTKNYQNLIIGFQVTVENVGDAFWDTVYVVAKQMSVIGEVLIIYRSTRRLRSSRR